MDLFQHPQQLSQEARDILSKYEDFNFTYEECGKMLAELETVGYTFEYYLDAEPYNLRRIIAKGEQYTYDEIKFLTENVGLSIADYTKEEYGKMIIGAYLITLEHKTKNIIMTFVLVKYFRGKSTFECVYTDEK